MMFRTPLLLLALLLPAAAQAQLIVPLTTADGRVACTQGQTGIGPITRFDARDLPSRIAGEVKNFDAVRFMEKNVKKYPGKSQLKFNILEPKSRSRVSMFTMGTGFEMNDEMAAFLHERPELEVQVITA